jgi:hypothetical protein
MLAKDIEISVPENLYCALYYLRTTENRLLWNDQSNPDERIYEMRLMTFVYSRAEFVLVWSGGP